jgi:2-keto-4-pentenoate hydratase/2-oxohepta-3-ene-1,7-dioic acid hydratase in catechol pathway
VRLVNYIAADGVRVGATYLTPDGARVIDLHLAAAQWRRPWRLRGVEDVLALPDGEFRDLAGLVRSVVDDPEQARSLPTLAAGSVRLAPPVRPAPLILCCGLNFAAHRAEMNEQQGRGPSWFIKNHNAVIATEDDILVPDDHTEMVDFEGEIAVVFKRECHKVSVSDAVSYVGGYTLVNDVTARDWAPGAPLEFADPVRGVMAQQAGKQYPTFCPTGPALLTADEVDDPRTLSFVTELNGVPMQDGRLTDLVLDIPHLIAAVSQTYRLLPGDVLSTGSPSGTGFARTPPRFLKPGDVVTITAPGIGTLRNRVGRLASPVHVGVGLATRTAD